MPFHDNNEIVINIIAWTSPTNINTSNTITIAPAAAAAIITTTNNTDVYYCYDHHS